MLPVFITGNQNKVDYLSETIGMVLPHRKIDLDEIQSPDPIIVVEHKVRQAYDIIRKPVLVEDTLLGFNALNGLPGTFVKFFVESQDGLQNMCRMLDGFDDRTAYASAMYAYYDGNDLKIFSGRLNGNISSSPRGNGGYGWDAIFEPEGYDGLTRAELNPELDRESYDKIRDTESLKRFLQEAK